ncbi:SPOR domain-containing protein, partial [Phenylobacterium sp.]|uniref:SPOR domain-containing protein n=1 Tax=Phenylobacterium sp. TaxID=1871053 RepID=UPI0025DEB41B
PAVAAPPPKVSSPPPKASSPQRKASPAPRKPTPVAPPPVATAAPAAAPASGPAAGHTGGTSVQVGSYPDRAAATAALAKLAGGQAHTLEAATVSGRTWYRAVVSGFASGEAAGRYCEALKAKGGVCFVRR